MTQPISSSTIEPWQLTAYALNELEPSQAAKVEFAMKADPALRVEFEQILQTLTAVRNAMSNTSAKVGLSDSQSAIVSSHIEQVDAPRRNVVDTLSHLTTVQLQGRPFYRRKRFAALLATAAAIPIAATWLPTWLGDSGPSLGYVAKDRLSGNIYLGDSPKETAEAVSSTGLPAASGSPVLMEKEKQEANDPVAKNEIASTVAIDAAERRLKYLNSFQNAGAPADTAAGMGSRGLSESNAQAVAEASIDSKSDTLMMVVTPQISIPEEESEAIGVNPNATDNFASSSLGGAVTGSSGTPSPVAASPGTTSLAKGGGYGADSSFAMGASGASGALGYSTQLAMDESRLALLKEEEASRSIRGYDKRLKDSDRELDVQGQLPVELRQNAPHLFRSRASETSGTDRFERIVETPFLETKKSPLSTFSIDVDTASYSKIRQTIMEGNRLPSPNMVRIEEMVNYFDYGYAGPQDGRPFAAHMSIDRCPWNSEHQLIRVGLQAKKLETDKRVKANIVFLLDVSGSMNEPNKLPLVKKSLSMMVNQLNENDRVAIVVYAGAAGCVLPSTCGAEKHAILSSLEHLNAGGSTNGGQGIQLAYSIAKEHFVPGGANRVVLCTDGDFNVGVTGDDALVAMMQENAKSNIFLTCLGFGAGNYNDTLMEKISNKGNGTYGMIDNELEARRMMVEQLGGTLVTVAKDVKIQVDFNPAKVGGYRLIGYEDRRLANKDFDNDQKDAGEIGAGHRVTALYEVIPVGKWLGSVPTTEGETSKYSKNSKPETSAESLQSGEFSAELLTLKVRYKEPEGSISTKQEFVLKDTDRSDQPLVDRDMEWATSVAEFGLLLRRSEMAPHADWAEMLERAAGSAGGDPYKLECVAMMRKARSMYR